MDCQQIISTRVSDPHHFNAGPDPDPSFHFNADPEPEPAPNQSDAYLRPLVYKSCNSLKVYTNLPCIIVPNDRILP